MRSSKYGSGTVYTLISAVEEAGVGKFVEVPSVSFPDLIYSTVI